MKLFLSLLPLFLAACSQTPLTRIDKNPAIYQALTPEQQNLVKSGRIDKGMPKPGVFLAWGPPNRTLAGQQDQGTFEQWDYNALRPVYINHFSIGYGTGFGRFSHPYTSFGFGPEIAYIPYPTGSVIFKNDRVTEWHQIR